jgi:hypothetical protein
VTLRDFCDLLPEQTWEKLWIGDPEFEEREKNSEVIKQNLQVLKYFENENEGLRDLEKIMER